MLQHRGAGRWDEIEREAEKHQAYDLQAMKWNDTTQSWDHLWLHKPEANNKPVREKISLASKKAEEMHYGPRVHKALHWRTLASRVQEATFSKNPPGPVYVWK